MTEGVGQAFRRRAQSNSDETVLVAFPMPEIKISDQDENISIPTEDPVNILGFTTVVNGRPVKTEVQQRVFANGVDRTQLLTSLKIPLAPHLQATNQALDKLPKDRSRRSIYPMACPLLNSPQWYSPPP